MWTWVENKTMNGGDDGDGERRERGKEGVEWTSV